MVVVEDHLPGGGGVFALLTQGLQNNSILESPVGVV